MLKMEVKASASCKRWHIVRSVLLQPFTYFKLESNIRRHSDKYCKNSYINTENHILDSY